MSTDAAHLARQLAARRPRATYQCAVCSRPFAAVIQKDGRTAKTCSPKCRQKLHRQTKQQQKETGR